MDVYVSLLQNYLGRDKILRTTGYGCVLLSGAFKGHRAASLGVFAKNISAARTMLRFFDDLPMLKLTKYSINSQDRDPINKVLTVLGNVAIQIYFPVEHIAWFMDNKIIQGKDASNWWTAGIALWGLSLFFGILRNLRNLGKIRYKKAKLYKTRKLESQDSETANAEFRKNLAELKQQEFAEVLTLFKNWGDIMMAVNWLPAGFLWAGKFGPIKTALFGCISSLIGLYMLVVAEKKKLASKEN